MQSGMFYRGGSSLTSSITGQGSSAGCKVERAYVEGTYGGYPPDPSFALYQKLDAIANMLNEHKTEIQTETAQLKEKVSNLGSEVAKLKQQLEDTAQSSSSSSQCARIPCSLSASVSANFSFLTVLFQEAVKALHDGAAESEKFEGSER